MSRHPRRDTLPELRLRRALHARGLRYRVDARPEMSLRRRADVVFRGARVAVFVDGCFWHGCPEHAVLTDSNRAWWAAKLAANQARDQDTTAQLQAAGWLVIRVWEHEDAESAARDIEASVRQRRSSGRAPP
jgi:DNA mismatch endonuclease (patch repair protein)